MGDLGGTIQRLIISLPVFLLAIILHEVAHGYVALLCGDDTAKLSGRLTLSPLAHLDVMGTIMFVISSLTGFGFGWAKPVPVNPLRFRHPRRDDILVSLAGISTNLAQAVIWAGLAWIIFTQFSQAAWAPAVGTFCALGVAINLLFAMFNLLPFPPLDGSHVAFQLLGLRDPLLYVRLIPIGVIALILFIRSSAYTWLLDTIYFPVLYRVLPIDALYGLYHLLS